MIGNPYTIEGCKLDCATLYGDEFTTSPDGVNCFCIDGYHFNNTDGKCYINCNQGFRNDYVT
jgi:hypothetical protein